MWIHFKYLFTWIFKIYLFLSRQKNKTGPALKRAAQPLLLDSCSASTGCTQIKPVSCCSVSE